MGFIVDGLTKWKRTGDPLIRDFTPSAESRMIEISKRVNKNETAGDKYVTDAIGRYLDRKGYLYLMDGIINYEESVIDAYNYGAEEIKEICKMARSYDSSYSSKISQNESTACQIGMVLNELAECLDVNSKAYSSEDSITSRLYGFYGHEFIGKDGKKYRIATISAEINERHRYRMPDPISSEEIIEFCNTEGVEIIFEEYTDYVYKELDDRGLLSIVYTAAGTVIYKGVEMTVAEFLSLVTNENYMDRLVRQNLNIIITNMINGSKDFQTMIKDYDTAKEALEEWIKKLEKANEEGTVPDDLKDFAKFVEKMGGIETFKSMMKNAPQLLDYLFTDYSKGLDILEQMKITCDKSGNEEMRKAIEKLLNDYENKWLGVLTNAKDFLEDIVSGKSTKAFEDWIEDNCESGSILKSLLEIAVDEDDIDAEHKLIALRKIESDLEEAYKDAIEKIRSGSYDEDDLEYAKNMFDALKETEISIYRAYLELCDDDPKEQININRKIERLERMNMQYPDPWKFDS